MIDELTDYGQDSNITEFASVEPKTYVYKVLFTKTDQLETVCKLMDSKLRSVVVL